MDLGAQLDRFIVCLALYVGTAVALRLLSAVLRRDVEARRVRWPRRVLHTLSAASRSRPRFRAAALPASPIGVMDNIGQAAIAAVLLVCLAALLLAV
jgi:hypothetical protein